MKTLSEHNKDIKDKYNELIKGYNNKECYYNNDKCKNVGIGVKCDECGTELHDHFIPYKGGYTKGPTLINFGVHCSKCKFEGILNKVSRNE